MECIEHPIDSAKFGGRHTVQILRNGDLATRLYLRMDLPALPATAFTKDACGNELYDTKAAWVRRVGHALVKNVEITIGGSQIDKHWSVWMDLWYELTHTQEQERGYNKMIGDIPELTELQGKVSTTQSDDVVPAYTLYVPLQFWFCRNTGLALPLIALQYHEVRLNIELEALANLIVQSGYTDLTLSQVGNLGSCGLMVDYVYLDSEERRRFAQVGHEYLIEQVQYNGEESIVTSGTTSNAKHKLEFNHPSKELVWAPQVGAWTAGETFLTYTGAQHDNAWQEALDAAAENVAEGMFLLAAGTSTTTGVPSGWQALTLPTCQTGASYVTPVNQPAGLNITVLVNNLESTAIASGVSPLCYNTSVLTNTKVSGSGTASLGDKISDVLVTLTVENSAANAWTNVECQVRVAATGATGTDTFVSGTNNRRLVPTGSVKVVRHSLNLSEVSVPVSDLNDARAEVACGAVSVRDVIVLQPFNYGLQLDGQGLLVANAQLKLNGHDRFSVQDGPYFNYVQPAQHHTRTPCDGVSVYSFALHPEQHQPSGSANLSRIDTTLLCVTYSDNLRAPSEPRFESLFTNTVVNIFDFSYNVLRVMSGMAGVAYAN
jgi:hypothetical protein